MAIVLSKEELLNKIKGTVETSTQASVSSSSSSFVEQLATILNNPAIQQIILRIFNRIMPDNTGTGQIQPLQQPTQPNGEFVYNTILNILTLIEQDNPKMTIQELKKKLQEEKDKIMGVLNAGVVKK